MITANPQYRDTLHVVLLDSLPTQGVGIMVQSRDAREHPWQGSNMRPRGRYSYRRNWWHVMAPLDITRLHMNLHCHAKRSGCLHSRRGIEG